MTRNNVKWYNNDSVESFQLSRGALKILHVPNAGGSSVRSEVMSYEIIRGLMPGTELHKTEMEIEYFPRGSKKTDYSIMASGQCLGVSVTRAMNYFVNQTFQSEDARAILYKKLNGVVWSTRNNYSTNKMDVFRRQILHVFAQNEEIAGMLQEEYYNIPLDIRSDTIVIVTVTPEKGSKWLYYE
ncbi:hypothetical protein AKO1_012558 [Acrasis kona]|uniref:Uncharacterized protein n=1 Tax=Acrasis kona TaxID=1008807 RepID=A0AAW2YYD4_9EUKA